MGKTYFCRTVEGHKYCCPDNSAMFNGDCCQYKHPEKGVLKLDNTNCSKGVPFPSELTDSSGNTEIEYEGNTYRDLDPDSDQ